ncbi:Uncharacterised protein [Candidatus Tiddalikarchaeum anstoanum]|nr:Uncharacterised protein [Candidatus Tiddalikarchaeum anstoanum]
MNIEYILNVNITKKDGSAVSNHNFNPNSLEKGVFIGNEEIKEIKDSICLSNLPYNFCVKICNDAFADLKCVNVSPDMSIKISNKYMHTDSATKSDIEIGEYLIRLELVKK